MPDAGLTYVIDRLLGFTKKSEASEYIANDVGAAHVGIAGRLLARLSYPRTTSQNALYYKWIAEIAQQTGETELEVRRFVKFTFGLPILFRTMSEQARLCREHLKGMTFEEKKTMMDLFAVSSLMKTTEMKEYMDQIAIHYRSQGLTLTEPKEG